MRFIHSPASTPPSDRLSRLAATAVLAGIVGLATLTAGCESGESSNPAAGTPAGSAQAKNDPQVVHFGGVPEMRFGDTEHDLIKRGMVIRDVPQCGPRMVKPTGASPVFIDGRLALVWADPPLHTPEGIAVGATIARVRSAYPTISELTAPAGSYRFNGLLVSNGDRAYLFLHDGRTVQKLIVGYAKHARTLFTKGFTGC